MGSGLGVLRVGCEDLRDRTYGHCMGNTSYAGAGGRGLRGSSGYSWGLWGSEGGVCYPRVALNPRNPECSSWRRPFGGGPFVYRSLWHSWGNGGPVRDPQTHLHRPLPRPAPCAERYDGLAVAMGTARRGYPLHWLHCTLIA